MNQYKNIEELFPYVQHNLGTICKTVLGVAQFYSNRAFSSVDVKGLDKLIEFKTRNPESNVVYISCHKSQIDPFETQLPLAKAGMPTRIQAGDNLFIGPFDPLLRKFGAFMAIRESRGFYSKKWLLNMAYSALPKKVGPYEKHYELYIDKKKAKELYESYLGHILPTQESSNDLLVYPGYSSDSGGKRKYGRSYSGRLNDFSLYVFIVLHRIIQNLDKEFYFIIVNPSYERRIEDSFMVEIPQLKEKFSQDLVYLKEFAYIATRPFFPFFRQSKCVLKFGEPYKIEKLGNVKHLAFEDAKRLKYEVGLLETPFSPQIIFYSMVNEPKVELSKLEDCVMANILYLDEKKVDTSYLKSKGSAKSIDTLLDETLHLFDAPGRRFVKVKGNSLEVLNKEVIDPYAKNIAHFFKDDSKDA